MSKHKSISQMNLYTGLPNSKFHWLKESLSQTEILLKTIKDHKSNLKDT